MTEPRAVPAEFGTILPGDVDVRVHDSTAMVRYLVLPRRPEATKNFTEEELAALVTRNTMIGVDAIDLALLDAAQRSVEHLERAAASSSRPGCGGYCRGAGMWKRTSGRPAFASCSPIAS